MAREVSIGDLDTLLRSIKSSEVAETRKELLSELSQLHLPQNFNLAPLIEYLTTFWEDFTCSGISQCMLNRTILHAAAQYVDSHLSSCPSQFLVLAAKASTWCGKHLKTTLVSTEGFQEDEHCNFFIQLLLDLLSFSAATMTGFPVSSCVDLAAHIESFVTLQLQLIQDVVTDIKRISSCRVDVLRSAQTAIDAVVRLCTECFRAAVGWELPDLRCDDGGNEPANLMQPFVSVMECAINKLCDLGAMAACDGGNLVSVLNVSWKGVLALAQLGRRQLRRRVSVQHILKVSLSLVKEPLRCAAEAWSSSLNDQPVSVADARRIFLPVKFHLLNAVRLTSLFPCDAYAARKDVALCILLMSTFGILSCREEPLRAAAEVFSELIEKLTVDIAASMLNSEEATDELRSEFLDLLAAGEGCATSQTPPGCASADSSGTTMAAMFSASAGDVCRARVLLLGRVALFTALLRCSNRLVEIVRIKLAGKLVWLADVLVDAEIYPFVLYLQIPVQYCSEKTLGPAWHWHPLFSVILHALKTFMVVAYPVAGAEIEAFLLENVFHPHFLCVEMATELWCFLVRGAEKDTAGAVVDKLLSLAKQLASPESVAAPRSPLRRMAKLICLLLVNAAPSAPVVDHAFGSVGDEAKQHHPSPSSTSHSRVTLVLRAALLSEGFPLDLLSGSIRAAAKQQIAADYFRSAESFKAESRADHHHHLRTFGIQASALASSLQSCRDGMPDADVRTLELLVAVARSLRSRPEGPTKERYLCLLGEALGVVSSMRAVYERDEMVEVVAELHGLFVEGQPLPAADAGLHRCKPYLAVFMGGLGGMEMSEDGDCAGGASARELFHMLFRERHWALVHLAVASFGYFAARTGCTRLWKFIPHDAALSFDPASGSEAEEERFMAELKAFLEKKAALIAAGPGEEQSELLVREGSVLADVKRRSLLDAEDQDSKRRRLPRGIGTGLQMLEGGLGVFGDGLSRCPRDGRFWPPEHHRKLADQFSLLEDAVSHLAGLVTFF